jgi:aryl-alcohol dehydrogenase-like predicted oxidoreductase
MPYGVANVTGQVVPTDVRAILDLARRHGVDTLDTAIGYGDSEAELGRAGVDDFKIITKLPALPPDVRDVANWLLQQVQASMARLGVQRLHGLLLHRPGQLQGPHGQRLAAALATLRRRGEVERLGVSIYDPEELEPVLAVMTPDLVQAPLNLIDQRLIESGWLERLHRLGVKVHARSVFLQGLLLMPRQARLEQFAAWTELWARWHDWQQAQGADAALNACLAFVLSHPQIERVLVGVDNPEQFAQLLQTVRQLRGDWPSIACDDPELVNPSRWSRP